MPNAPAEQATILSMITRRPEHVHEQVRQTVFEVMQTVEAQDVRAEALERRLDELHTKLPQPPRSQADVVALAQIAAFWSDWWSPNPEPEDRFDRTVKQLIAGVLHLDQRTEADAQP